jgi:hypothetical protein
MDIVMKKAAGIIKAHHNVQATTALGEQTAIVRKEIVGCSILQILVVQQTRHGICHVLGTMDIVLNTMLL